MRVEPADRLLRSECNYLTYILIFSPVELNLACLSIVCKSLMTLELCQGNPRNRAKSKKYCKMGFFFGAGVVENITKDLHD